MGATVEDDGAGVPLVVGAGGVLDDGGSDGTLLVEGTLLVDGAGVVVFGWLGRGVLAGATGAGAPPPGAGVPAVVAAGRTFRYNAAITTNSTASTSVEVRARPR
jgi:hypothetical protein